MLSRATPIAFNASAGQTKSAYCHYRITFGAAAPISGEASYLYYFSSPILVISYDDPIFVVFYLLVYCHVHQFIALSFSIWCNSLIYHLAVLSFARMLRLIIIGVELCLPMMHQASLNWSWDEFHYSNQCLLRKYKQCIILGYIFCEFSLSTKLLLLLLQ